MADTRAAQDAETASTEQDVPVPTAGSPIPENASRSPQPELKLEASSQTNALPTSHQEATGPPSSPTSPAQDDSTAQSRLAALGASVRDQDDLERNINLQASQLLTSQSLEREHKRLQKTEAERSKLVFQIEKLAEKLASGVGGAATRVKAESEIAHYEAQVTVLDRDLDEIRARVEEREKELEEFEGQDGAGNGGMMEGARAGGGGSGVAAQGRQPGESQRDFLIRTGKITPFSKMGSGNAGLKRTASNLRDVMYDAEQDHVDEDEEDAQEPAEAVKEKSHRNLIRPGFAGDRKSRSPDKQEQAKPPPAKKRKLEMGDYRRMSERRTARNTIPSTRETLEEAEDSAFKPAAEGSADESLPEADGTDAEEEYMSDTPAAKPTGRKKTVSKSTDSHVEDLTGLDDGNERLYQRRLEGWISRRSSARAKHRRRSLANGPVDGIQTGGQTADGEDGEPAEAEWHQPHPSTDDMIIDDEYRLPGDIHASLFDYQKTGVQWLCELHSQRVGGIVGDEMGLGKTIQVISFLAGLHYSKKISKPVLVVAPATVMKQWVNEFHTWWPPFRVSILHTSGSGMIDLGRESRFEDDLLEMAYTGRRKGPSKTQKAARRIVERVVADGHILVTTYSGLQTYAELLIPVDWEYAVLDEGHKIRNPNASITIHCKELRTANRVILSGTPMQNNLVELWSLFDFVFPMRLGTLVNFRQQFEVPIRQGGYANASNLQVQTASHCAEALKDSIAPYLLQRLKVDVAADLPRKTEQVLFCRLTRPQRDAYEAFLDGEEMKSIVSGRRQMLYGVDILRKICNHPDLVQHRTLSTKAGYSYGQAVKSGKMVVVKELLDIWRKGGHKTLLFAQHRIMLDILERYIGAMPGIRHCRMDGNTPVPLRQRLVDEFNGTPDLHVFLLTTKVGGLGINLTGADRVIIFDPDWNPSTDIQARERAWRLGQKREVQIFRLMVAGTIEEKIFHRQIFKQFLTNKILKDPKQRQTFQLKDLHDLFSLGGVDEQSTETGRLFEGAETRIEAEERAGPPRTTKPADDTAWGGATPPPSPPAKGLGDAALGDMAGIAAVRAYAPDEQDGGQTNGGATASNADREKRLMTSLFARSGVHSALEHDQIINGKRAVVADPRTIEKAARLVAAEAAAALKRAEAVARSQPVGVPTWTGLVGEGGREEEVAGRRGGAGMLGGRGGPSSAAVLAGLRGRLGGGGGGGGTSVPSPRAGARRRDEGPRGKDFLALIRDYLRAHGGAVYTQMLIDHFNRYCSTPERSAEFKAMLREIAVLEKGVGGRGKWWLKGEHAK